MRWHPRHWTSTGSSSAPASAAALRLAEEGLPSRGPRARSALPRRGAAEIRLAGPQLHLGCEAFGNMPMTAHVIGGAVIGADADSGVLDQQLRVFGYENLIVCDAAALPANPGVNPAPTITVLAEYGVAQVPTKVA